MNVWGLLSKLVCIVSSPFHQLERAEKKIRCLWFFTAPEQCCFMDFSFSSKMLSAGFMYSLIRHDIVLTLAFFSCKNIILSGMHCFPSEINFAENLWMYLLVITYCDHTTLIVYLLWLPRILPLANNVYLFQLVPCKQWHFSFRIKNQCDVNFIKLWVCCERG